MVNYTLKLKKAILTATTVGIAVAVLLFSNEIRQGVKNGLSLSACSVIPSLFIFTAISLFIIKSGAGQVLGRLISPVTRPLLGLNADQSSVILISMVAGYPVGAKLLNSLYLDGKISRGKALKMLNFSINAGPAFIIVTVGQGFLKNRSDGCRLLICHLLATLILAVAVRFLPDRLFSNDTKSKKQTLSKSQRSALSDIFVLSVLEAGKTMLNVTIFVVFFAGLTGGFSAFGFANTGRLTSLFEVTAGLSNITRSQLPFAAFLLGFGGISVIFQVISSAESLRPKFTHLLLFRLLHGGFSYSLAIILEIFFPRDLMTGTFNIQPDAATVHTSPFAALSLLLLCIVLLFFLGSVRRRNETY